MTSRSLYTRFLDVCETLCYGLAVCLLVSAVITVIDIAENKSIESARLFQAQVKLARAWADASVSALRTVLAACEPLLHLALAIVRLTMKTSVAQLGHTCATAAASNLTTMPTCIALVEMVSGEKLNMTVPPPPPPPADRTAAANTYVQCEDSVRAPLDTDTRNSETLVAKPMTLDGVISDAARCRAIADDTDRLVCYRFLTTRIERGSEQTK